MSKHSQARSGRVRASAVDTDADLSKLIEDIERVNWRAVPGVSSSTAASFAAQLDAARADLEASADR